MVRVDLQELRQQRRERKQRANRTQTRPCSRAFETRIACAPSRVQMALPVVRSITAISSVSLDEDNSRTACESTTHPAHTLNRSPA